MPADEGMTTPDRAFWLLSDETRLDILRSLWAADTEAVAFSTLRARVGSPDSGKFNYHLGELEGHFVAKGDDGYELTQAGREVVRAVLAGTLTERPELEPAPIDERCVECGGSLVVRYDGRGAVECADCGATVMWNEFPPAGFAERSPREFAVTFDRWVQSRFRLAMDGICPNCACEMRTSISEGDVDHSTVATVHRCRNCRYEARVPLFGHAIHHPATVSFYHERGVDVTSRPYWELRALADGYTEEVVAEDPWTARVTVRADGATLRLDLDENLAVVDVDMSNG